MGEIQRRYGWVHGFLLGGVGDALTLGVSMGPKSKDLGLKCKSKASASPGSDKFKGMRSPRFKSDTVLEMGVNY